MGSALCACAAGWACRLRASTRLRRGCLKPASSSRIRYAFAAPAARKALRAARQCKGASGQATHVPLACNSTASPGTLWLAAALHKQPVPGSTRTPPPLTMQSSKSFDLGPFASFSKIFAGYESSRRVLSTYGWKLKLIKFRQVSSKWVPA